MKAAMRFAVGTRVGYGHAMRSVALAEELVRQVGADVRFFPACDKRALEWIRETGFPFEPDLDPNMSRPGEAPPALLDFSPDVVVIDAPAEVSAGAIDRIHEAGSLCVLVDDLGPGRLSADLCFLPTRAAEEAALWTGARGRRFCGPDYAFVRGSIAAVKCRVPDNAYRVLVVMGGSDPDGLTLAAIDALERVGRPVLADIVVGFGFPHFAKLATKLAAVEGMYFCHFAVRDMASLMARAHLALVAYGSIIYEMASAGVPMIAICRTEKQEREAGAFCELGCGVTLGRIARGDVDPIASAVDSLCEDRGRRRAMARAGSSAVDGRGAERAAREIARSVTGRWHPETRSETSRRPRATGVGLSLA